MPEHIAIVGSRQGANLDDVRSFVEALWQRQPDSVVVSGGAAGVDSLAESEWSRRGGKVKSFRPIALGLERYAIQTWEYGGDDQPRVYIDTRDPDFTNYSSACLYRDMLIAETATRLVAFYRRGRSRGTAFTVENAREAHGKPVYEYEAAA